MLTLILNQIIPFWIEMVYIISFKNSFTLRKSALRLILSSRFSFKNIHLFEILLLIIIIRSILWRKCLSRKLNVKRQMRQRSSVLQMIIWEVWFPVADCMLNLVFTSMLKNHASKKKNCFSVNEKPNVNV